MWDETFKLKKIWLHTVYSLKERRVLIAFCRVIVGFFLVASQKSTSGSFIKVSTVWIKLAHQEHFILVALKCLGLFSLACLLFSHSICDKLFSDPTDCGPRALCPMGSQAEYWVDYHFLLQILPPKWIFYSGLVFVISPHCGHLESLLTQWFQIFKDNTY